MMKKGLPASNPTGPSGGNEKKYYTNPNRLGRNSEICGMYVVSNRVGSQAPNSMTSVGFMTWLSGVPVRRQPM